MNGREPELVDYIEVLRRQWKLVLVGTLASALATIVIILVWVVHYEAHCDVEIGKVAGELLEDPYFTAAEVTGPGFALPILEKAGLSGVRPERIKKYISAEVTEGGVLPNLKPIMLHLTASQRSPEAADALLDLVVQELMKRHNRKFTDGLKAYNEYRAQLKARIDSYEKDLQRMQPIQLKMVGVPEASTSTALVLQNQLVAFVRDLQELQIKIDSELHTRPTRLVDPSIPARRFSPPFSILVLEFLGSAVAGFLIFAFIAFLRDYLQRAKPQADRSA